MPLHIAAMQQGKEAETVVMALLNAHPDGVRDKDNVRGTRVAPLERIQL